MSAYEHNHAKVLELEVEIRDLYMSSLLSLGKPKSALINDLMEERIERQEEIMRRTGEIYPVCGQAFDEYRDQRRSELAHYAKINNARHRQIQFAE